MLSKMRKRQGFTLIELMIVVAIIGILAAIAIPQFQAYRQRGYDSAAKSLLKNLGTAQEAYFADWAKYTTVRAGLVSAGLATDANVTVRVTSGAGTGYTAVGWSPKGTASTSFQITSGGGGVTKK